MGGVEPSRGRIVDTGSNTIRDSLDLVPATATAVAPPDGPFGIVSLHRFELLNSRRRLLAETIESARRSGRDDATALHRPSGDDRRDREVRARPASSTRYGFDADSPLRFFDFVRLERRCEFVVAPVKFVPVIVTRVPPVVGPLAGLTCVTEGTSDS